MLFFSENEYFTDFHGIMGMSNENIKNSLGPLLDPPLNNPGPEFPEFKYWTS